MYLFLLYIYIYICIYDYVQKIKTVLGRNPDKTRNTYKNQVLITKLLYFYRAQPCTIIHVFLTSTPFLLVLRFLSRFLPKMVLIWWAPSCIYVYIIKTLGPRYPRPAKTCIYIYIYHKTVYIPFNIPSIRNLNHIVNKL